MSEGGNSSNFFTFQARVASLTGLAIVPFLPMEFLWPILAITVVTFAITLACEAQSERKKVFLICIAGLLVSGIIVSLISAFFIQIVLFLVTVTGLSSGLYEGSGLNSSRKNGQS